MRIGTYYYPEQWPREQWERDFDNIEAMGLQIVHMGEFAWFDLEPSPGEFQLDWLAECVQMAKARDLKVILCTPTAAPPIWLVEQHPEILPLHHDGRVHRFGGRCHYSPTCPAMLQAAQRIANALAERFMADPAVIGWQIDNEYSAQAFDQHNYTHSAFRQWLKQRYGTLKKLNRAWAGQFWNTYYTDFDQVLMPSGRGPNYDSPHYRLDGSRFWSWAYGQFNKMQVDALKSHLSKRPAAAPELFFTTNFMPFHLDVNPEDMADDLNLMSWDSYPVSGWTRQIEKQEFRMGDPAQIGFMHDQMASYHQRWGLMELQPGQVNWSGVPCHLYPGAVRLWIWTAFAHGAEFVTTYRFRQPLFGVELFHHGLMDTDGITPSAGGREFVQVLGEMKRLDAVRLADPTRAQTSAKAPTTIGLLFDFEQLWQYQTLPQAKRWDQARFYMMWYAAACRLGAKVCILHPDRPWTDEPDMLIVPGLQMIDPTLAMKLERYANDGGHLLLTCRTALMDKSGQLWEGPVAEPILPLIGGTIDAYDGLPENTFGKVEMDGEEYQWGVWGDLLYAEPDTRILAKYADQFYAEAIAAMQVKRGKGTVSYCGVYAEQPFTDALMVKIAKLAKLPITPLPARVQILQRGPYSIALNYQDAILDVPAPRNARFLVGSRKLEPAGVAVWEIPQGE